MHQLSLTRKDRYQSQSPDQTKLFTHIYPSNSVSSFILPASEPYIKQTSSYPGASVLRCQASEHCDCVQPLQQQYQLRTIQGTKMILMTILCAVKNEDEI